jgi:hypothetical protein
MMGGFKQPGTVVGRSLGACFQTAMLPFCAQESECSPQRRIVLGLSQHSAESLTFLVAEDFLRARFAHNHRASNRHGEVGQALLPKPPREFVDLFRGA